MIRRVTYYATFFLVSILVHWILFFPWPFAEKKPEEKAGAPASSKVAIEVAQQAAEQPKPDPQMEELKKQKEEAEKKVQEMMQQFKDISTLMQNEMAKIQKESEAKIEAERALREELERKVTESQEALEKEKTAKSEAVDEELAKFKEEMKELREEQKQAEREKADLARRLAEAEKARETKEQEAERKVQEQLARNAREVERLKEEARQRDEAAKVMQQQLAAEQEARRRDDEKRRAEFAEMQKKIEESRRASAKAAPSPTRTSHKAADVTTMDEYIEFVRPHLARTIRKEGVPLPIPNFSLSGTGELLDLVNYYRFRLVVYPEAETKRSYFVEVDVDASGRSSFRRVDDRQQLFNTMVIRLDGIEYFERIKQDLVDRGGLVEPGSGVLTIGFVTPEDRARYFRWKALRVCEENDQPATDVFQCVGLFRKTPFGAWVFLIDHLVLDSGKLVRVKDFEAEKVFGN